MSGFNARIAFWLTADAPAAFEALRLDGDRLAALARRRLAGVLRAAAQTEFYRERFNAAGIDVADPALDHDPETAFAILAALPPISKTDLRDTGTGLLVGGRVGAGWRSSRSSGSTGEPVRVYYDPRAWAMLKYLVKLRARLECGMQLTDRVVSLDAASREQLGPRSPAWPGRRFLQLNVVRPAEEIAAALRRFAPDIVTGLPSALLEAGGALSADAPRLAVRGLFTGGELLQRTTRDALERLYATHVFDVYGTSETKEIAWECRLGRRHLNADVVSVEILDPAGRPLPPGREGEIVATVLVNRAMPLLRYRTGDWGSLLADRCPCGRATPLLGVVTGRETETLVFAGGRRVSPYALTCTMEQIPGLTRYQIVQLGPTHLTVRAIVSGATDRRAIADQVRAMLRSEVASTLDVRVEFVEHLPTGPQAKFRVVQRMETL